MRTLVVGASGELGSAIARRLARGKHQLVLHGYSDHLALNSVADEVGAIDIAYVDARSEQAIRDAVVQAASSGPLNGLVYAAGINPTAATVANTSSEDWINTIAIN